MAIVSSSHNFIYISGGKCATITIDSALKQNKQIRWYDPGLKTREDRLKYDRHMPAKIMKSRITRDEWDFFKFTFVRNPYSWIVSSYFYLVQKKMVKAPINGIMERQNFEDTIHYYQSPIGRRYDNTISIRTQYDFISDERRNILVDFIGRIENLQDDFDKICDKITIPHFNLEIKNKSKCNHLSYQNHYTTETKKLVEKYWSIDIEKFQYQF